MKNLELMKKRAIYNGGTKSNDRLIEGKRQTLIRVLNNSYNSEEISLNDGYTVRGLFNKKGSATDEKDLQTFSALFNNAFYEGALITRTRDNTKWLLYQQDENEKAYFMSYALKCYEYPLIANDLNNTTVYGFIAQGAENPMKNFGISSSTIDISISDIEV